MDIHEVYRLMIEAGNKAAAASTAFRVRESQIERREVAQWNRRYSAKEAVYDVDQAPPQLKLNISLAQDDDRELGKRFKRYEFWRNEQVRLGELLKAHSAYMGLVLMTEPMVDYNAR